MTSLSSAGDGGDAVGLLLIGSSPHFQVFSWDCGNATR